MWISASVFHPRVHLLKCQWTRFWNATFEKPPPECSTLLPTNNKKIMSSDADAPVDTSVDGSAPPLLPPLQPADDVAPAEEVDNAANTAALFYEKGGSCLKILVTMCLGLRDGDGNPILSLNSAPWKDFALRQIRPSKDEYINEVIRRWNRENSSVSTKLPPRPRKWNLPKIQEHLENNPIVNLIDIEFVKREVSARKEVAEAAQKENDDDNARLSAGNWNSDACMRLIHALVDHDHLKAKFLNRLSIPTGRSSIENREQVRASDVWHLLADKWNDKTFEPETVAMPELHTDLSFSDIILYAEVAHMTPATAEKVEDKWSAMVLEMNRCIANWQKSGQGEGGIDDCDNEKDHEFGSLENRTQHALASRQSFFKDRQVYLLYLWEMLNRHDLLGSALQRLNNSVSSVNGSSGVPSVVRRNDEEDSLTNKSLASAGGNSAIESLGKSIEKHGQSLVDIAKLDAKEKEMDRREKEKDRREKEKERIHNIQAQLLNNLQKLKGEKRSRLPCSVVSWGCRHRYCELGKDCSFPSPTMMSSLQKRPPLNSLSCNHRTL